MASQDLVERLLSHRRLRSAPRAQLEWLASHSTLRALRSGEVLVNADEPMPQLNVVISGLLSIRVDRGAGARRVLEWTAGEVTGLLPYSRMLTSPGRVVAEQPTEILIMPSGFFPAMIVECHELTTILVHVMLDRARTFTKNDLHDEKLLALGRLSAGLAHELNNPASALVRSSKELAESLFELESAAFALGSARLSPKQIASVGRARARFDEPGGREAMSPLERADRDDAIAAWLARHGQAADLARVLAETTLTVDSLEGLSSTLGPELLGIALRAVGAGDRTRHLTADIETATGRIHSLVAAIRGFTYMDQSNVPAPVAIGKGLLDTVAVLRSKAKEKSVVVTVEVEPGLPPVEGLGGELNQVWANLVDNAIDAAPHAGRVDVSAAHRDGTVVVRVVDDGPGVPEELIARIFDPFFTTKPQGQGTGLGLDIARRLVRQHDGVLEVESRPGRTEFRVVLPHS